MRILPYRRMVALYLAALVLSVVWASFEAGPLPFMTLYTLLLLPVASVVYLIAVNLSIRFHQEVSPGLPGETAGRPVSAVMREHRLTKGEPSSYQLLVENVGILPFARVTLCMETERAQLRGIEAEQELALRPGERWQTGSEIVCRYAGTYEVGLQSYRLEDCFHLFRVEFPAPAPFRVIVCPALPDENVRPPELDVLQNVLEVRTPYLEESSLGNDLREYRAGDSIRRIHWKNSARTGTLLTRLPEPKEMQRMQVVMIPEPVTDALPDVVRRDKYLEAAVALAYYFCRQKKPVLFCVPKGEIREKIVDSFETFRAFYENLPDEVRAIDSMDGAKWNEWIRGHSIPDGTVLLLREADEASGFLSVFDAFAPATKEGSE